MGHEKKVDQRRDSVIEKGVLAKKRDPVMQMLQQHIMQHSSGTACTKYQTGIVIGAFTHGWQASKQGIGHLV